MKIKQKSGFTLLEVIIVIIIVGVLASLALPRFFRTIEFSRSTEAFSGLQVLRGALERCYLARNFSYATCVSGGLAGLDVEDPGASPNAHFTYGLGSGSATGYTITATRTTRDGGTAGDTIFVTQTSTVVTRGGTTAFAGIQ